MQGFGVLLSQMTGLMFETNVLNPSGFLGTPCL